MKRLCLFIQLLLLAITVNATGQEGDIIYIDGVQWQLLGRPVQADSTLYHSLKDVLPKNLSISTGNWDGFISYWSIKQDALYLDSIRCEDYDAKVHKMVYEPIPTETLHRVFKQYVEGDRIVASWLTGDIRVATGKMIYYMHEGFERNYEEEQIISINNGKVRERKEYHNYVVDGFSFDAPQRYDIRKMFPLPIEQYPELAGAKRIVFSIKRARVDAQGNLVECELKVRPNDNPRLAKEMAESMKAYRPWRVLFINGEFSAKGIEGYTIPYVLDK